jgi:excisionase family DNA binding protein
MDNWRRYGFTGQCFTDEDAMVIANKDKHAYELLNGERISLGWLSEKDMVFLEGLKAAYEQGDDYFEMLRAIRGKNAYTFKGESRLTSKVAQSVLFRVASDIVERAGIKQGASLHPDQGIESPDAKPLCSMSEAAEIIGVSRAAVHQALTKGKLRGWMVGTIWVLARADVLAYRRNRETSSV